MSTSKKQRLLTKYLVSDESESTESMETLPLTSSNESDDVHYLRKFLPRWKMLFPWAEYEGGAKEVIYCSDCRQAGLKNEFARGKARPPRGWKKEYLRRHADSNDHTRHAPSVISTAKTAVSMFKPTKLRASERETVGLMIDVHFLATNGLSMNKGAALHSLIDFQVSFHNDEQSDNSDNEESASGSCRDLSSNPLSKTHRSTYSTWEFIHALNAVVEATDISKLQNAKFFSLLLDESNDVSNVKNLLVYCQFLNTERKKVEISFIKLLALQECNAEAIFTSVVKFFNNNSISLDKMIMFTSDGASVMLGCNNGVQAKLKSTVPHLLEFHCVAHREALSVSQAYQCIDYFVQLESTLRAIYSFFAHSSVRLERLKLVFNILDKKFVRLHKLFDVRWLSRLEAVKAIVRSYEALVMYFDDQADKEVAAEGIAKRLKKYRFVVSLHFLCDILSTLGQLNKTFQIPVYHPCDAQRKVSEVIQALKNRYLQKEIRWGPFAQECMQAIENNEINVDEREPTKRATERTRLENDVSKFVGAIVGNLEARFPNSEVIQAARIFDPKAIPTSDSDCVAYGEAELRVLTTKYSLFVNHNCCSIEWDTLKHCMKVSYCGFSFRDFTLKLATDKSLITHYPSLSKLAEIVLVYPSSTAEVERGFSYQNITKTKFRNRLGAVHLDQLLRLQLNAPESSQFPFHEAYKHWIEVKHRRYVIPQPTQKLDLEDSDSESSD